MRNLLVIMSRRDRLTWDKGRRRCLQSVRECGIIWFHLCLLTNHVWAIILVVVFALLAFEARPDLSADSNSVSDLDRLHLVANLDCMSNDFVADDEWEGSFAPAAIDGVDIATADAAAVNLDIDVVVAELLWFEL